MSTTVNPDSIASTLPQLDAPLFLSDGGMETTLVFHQGQDLPDFASFPLVDDVDGRAQLDRYYGPYFELARRHGMGIVADTPTWRANPDWGPRLGYDRDDLAAVNRRAVGYVRDLATRWNDVPAVLNGVVGPRGDGYAVGDAMAADEAASYHALQARAFADAGVDLVTAVTMTYVDEAVGVVRAVTDAGLPVAVGFTVETDGRLPSGASIGEAIDATDEATDGAAAYFMINCAHPTHFAAALDGDQPWRTRIKAIRANASRQSHEELDEAEELDAGDPQELAGLYRDLRALLPDLRVVGGCCGTDHSHLAHIADALVADA